MCMTWWTWAVRLMLPVLPLIELKRMTPQLSMVVPLMMPSQTPTTELGVNPLPVTVTVSRSTSPVLGVTVSAVAAPAVAGATSATNENRSRTPAHAPIVRPKIDCFLMASPRSTCWPRLLPPPSGVNRPATYWPAMCTASSVRERMSSFW